MVDYTLRLSDLVLFGISAICIPVFKKLFDTLTSLNNSVIQLTVQMKFIQESHDKLEKKVDNLVNHGI